MLSINAKISWCINSVIGAKARIDRPKTTAIVVTTYNWPEALRLCLSSISAQSELPDQIVIADDGSQPHTREMVSKTLSGLDYDYCWQPDLSFRAARARNLALSRITSDYVIFIDGDCVLPIDFVRNHKRLAEPKKLVAGSRNLLSKQKTDKYMRRSPPLIDDKDFFSRKFIQLPLGPLRYAAPSNWKSVRTCNMSLYIDDVLRVDGFDESYVGWGKEDSDLVIRLLNSGVAIKSGRFAVCVNHLNHKQQDRSELAVNEQKFRIRLNDHDSQPDTRSALSE